MGIRLDAACEGDNLERVLGLARRGLIAEADALNPDTPLGGRIRPVTQYARTQSSDIYYSKKIMLLFNNLKYF
jgi:hypothetical protein